MTRRDLLMLLLALVVAVVTWIGLNVGKMLYTDWAFLHAVRLASERQAVPPPQQPPK